MYTWCFTATTIYSRKYYFSLLGVSLAFTIGFHIGDKEIKEKQDQKKIVCNNNYVILRWNSRVHKHSHWNISFLQSHIFLVFFFRIEKKLNWKIKHWYCVIFFLAITFFFIIFYFKIHSGLDFKEGLIQKLQFKNTANFPQGWFFCSKNQSTIFFLHDQIFLRIFFSFFHLEVDCIVWSCVRWIIFWGRE